MATQIGFVKAIIGEVTAMAADGTIRTLNVGDQVFANELISTGPGGAVEIEFADGSVMDLGRNSQALLDSEMFDPNAPVVAETADDAVPDDIAAIQQALLEGEDPTQIGEATAAGAGVEGGNEGHDAVYVDYLNPAIIPDAGFDTIGVTNEYDLPEEDIIILEEETPNGFPSASDAFNAVDEDDLGPGLPFNSIAYDVYFFNADKLSEKGFAVSGYFADDIGNNDSAPGDDVATNQPYTSASGTLTVNYGPDGAGSLSLDASQPLLTGLTSEGREVLTYTSNDGETVIGYVMTGETIALIVFILEIDPDTLDYQFALYEPLDHPVTDTEDNIILNFNYTITDSNGDSASATISIDVDDDSPVVDLTLSQGSELPVSLVVDESVGTEGSDKDEVGLADPDDETVSAEDTDDIGYVTVSGEALFNVSVEPGADGEDTDARVFNLTLALAEGETEVDSGLDATDGGNIMLSINDAGTVVTGTDEDGHTVFTISIDSETGDVTVAQYEAIDHGADDNDHDSVLYIAEGLVGANITVYDNDGDSATDPEPVDIGSIIGFEDDGPFAVPDTGNVNEGALLTVNAANGVLADDASGTDGWIAADAGVVGVVATGDSPVISDLDDPTTLNTNIVGQYGTLVLQADGSYTYQANADVIDGDTTDLVDTFVYTVKDGDGDLTSTTLKITLADVTGTPQDTTGQVDEAGLSPLGTSAGDGSNQVINGALSFSGGFNNVEAQNGSTSLGTWSVADDGTFSYTLNTATTDVNAVPETDQFSYTATDDEGNSVINTVTITIIDDEPVFTIVNDGGDIDDVVSLITQNPTTDMTYLGNFADWAYGADDFASLSASSLPAGVQVDSVAVDGSQIVLNFYEGAGEDAVLVATLTLNADGQDSLDVYRREPDIEFIPVAATDAKAGGPEGALIVDLLNAADFNIIVTGDDGDGTPNEADDLVNTSNNGWAVKGQQGQTVEENESILFSFVDDGDNTSAFGIGDFKFRTEGYTGGITVATIAITISYIDADTMMEAFDTITMDVTSGQVLQISQLIWNTYEPGDSLTSVEITSNEPDGSFRLNGIEVGAESETPPADLSYDGIVIEIEDGDGDTDSQTFSLTIDGDTGDGLVVEAITGTSGDDDGIENPILIGTEFDDFLEGGAGDDILTGDTGADTFEFSMAYHTGNDAITDFEVGVDSLSFSDVVDADENGLDIADAISGVSDDGTDITLTLSNGGTVTLQGIGTGGVNDVASLETLIGADKINVDAS